MTHEEMIAVITAHKEGKTIEIMGKDYEAIWQHCLVPMWDFVHFDYRIKPEPQYRPFKDAEEVMEAIKEHGSFIKKQKDGLCLESVRRIYPSAAVEIGEVLTSAEDMCHNYVFADGTPFGVKED